MKKKTIKKSKGNTSLQKIVTGTSIIFIGLLVSLFFGLLSRVLIARYWTETQFGIYSLAYSILSICTIISSLGFNQGIPRSIAFSRGEKDYKKIRGFISSSIYLAIIASIIVGLALFLTSEFIAVEIFHEPALIMPLQIFSIAVPFFTLIETLIAIFRGFDQVKQTILYEQIILSILFLALILAIIVLDQPFINIFYAGVASFVIASIFLVNYSLKQIKTMKIIKIKSIVSPAAKELLVFSIPLLGTAMLNMIITWTDTLMLGGMKTAADVGLYNVSHNLAYLVSFPLGALLIIYIPIFSGLYAKKKFDEIKTNFIIITKWLCSFTLPLFIFLFLFPQQVIQLLFGANYVFAADALRILSFGFIINNYVGPCGVTLVTMGRSKFIMFATLATAIMNIVLNTFLIPVYGIMGAAIASATSLVSINIIKSIKLYSISGVQPISKNLLKPTFISLLLIIPAYLYCQSTLEITWIILIGLFIAFYVIYLFVFLLTKSVDEEDLNMIKMIEKKPGGNITKIRHFLSRYT